MILVVSVSSFTLKHILGLSIFLFGGSKERKNVALNVVDVAIFSSFEKLRHAINIWEGYLLHLQYDMVLEIL